MKVSNFYLAKLRRANFQNTWFDRFTCFPITIQFQGADLRDANFYGARLYNRANFNYARLQGADLRINHLFVADNLTFEGAEFDEFTRLPFSKREAIRRGMIFRPSQVANKKR